jgi:hypothetical protein
MMKYVRRLFASAVILASLSAIPVAHASSVFATRITTLQILGTQTAQIAFATGTGGPCQAAGYYFDITTSKGKALLTVATAALLSNVTLEAFGTGTCTTPAGVSFSGETLTALNIHSQ